MLTNVSPSKKLSMKIIMIQSIIKKIAKCVGKLNSKKPRPILPILLFKCLLKSKDGF